MRRSTLLAFTGLFAGALVVGLTGPALAASALPLTVDSTYQTNGRVDAILPIGNTVYIGGSFTSVRPAGARLGTGEVAR